MSGSGTADDPFTEFTPEMADFHWSNGNGETVYIDMASHMSSGGGSVFSPRDFATPFGQAVDGLPAGTTVRFETNRVVRIETDAERATAAHSYYGSDGFLSDGAFVWGNTAAGFRGTITTLENGNIYVDGQFRPFTEQFDYTANTWNPVLEAARLAGRIVAGPGTPYDIAFVGEDGLLISGEFHLHEFSAFGTYNMWSVDDQCFKSDTPIQMWPLDPSIKPRADGGYDEQLVLSKVWEKQISDIQVGDLVTSYDDNGRLQPGQVVRTMQNQSTHILDFWGTGVTPGHAYYCADGVFKGKHVPLMDILRTDGAIMRADGSFVRATTNCEVGSPDDRVIVAVLGDGETEPFYVRFGTRILLEHGQDVTVGELISANGGSVTEQGLVLYNGSEHAAPFNWTFSKQVPHPEDYILRRSQVDLEAIYLAGEWEEFETQLAAPVSIGEALNQTSYITPNIPAAFEDHSDAPNVCFAEAATQYEAASLGGEAAEAQSHEAAFEQIAKWATYNFEVAEHHTYVADRERVHNTSRAFLGIGRDDVRNAYLDVNALLEGGLITEEQLHESGDAIVNSILREGRTVNWVDDNGTQRSGSVSDYLNDYYGQDGRFTEVTDSNGNVHITDSEETNWGHEFGDRDDDGVPNIIDFNAIAKSGIKIGVDPLRWFWY